MTFTIVTGSKHGYGFKAATIKWVVLQQQYTAREDGTYRSFMVFAVNVFATIAKKDYLNMSSDIKNFRVEAPLYLSQMARDGIKNMLYLYEIRQCNQAAGPEKCAYRVNVVKGCLDLSSQTPTYQHHTHRYMYRSPRRRLLSSGFLYRSHLERNTLIPGLLSQ